MDDLTGDERRTALAGERTWMAWVRTGMTATAVSLAVGKLVPEVAEVHRRWPYALLGAGYGLLGVALILYGYRQRGESSAHSGALAALVTALVTLGLGVTLLAILS